MDSAQKAAELNYETPPIIMDGASVNVKVAKKILRQLNTEFDGEKVSIAELKLHSSFTHKGKICLCYFASFM